MSIRIGRKFGGHSCNHERKKSMSVQPDIGMGMMANEAIKRMKFVAIHKECGKEAFCYAIRPERGKELVGTPLYPRGVKPKIYTKEEVVKGVIHCVSCGHSIVNIDMIDISIETFTVKSMMRWVSSFGEMIKASDALIKAHVMLLEYAHLMGVDYNEWCKIQSGYEKMNTALKEQATDLYSRCMAMGACADAQKPSTIIEARDSSTLTKIQENIKN